MLLPTQLKWNLFVRALKTLKYKQLPSKGGSARHFRRGVEDPVTFHEPHGNDTLRQGTLTEYLRKLKISREEFDLALAGLDAQRQASVDEERFRRTSLPNGNIVSNCMTCFNLVADAPLEEIIIAAELEHVCPASS
jgi:hypothetical protein